MLQVLKACVVDKSVAMDQEMRFESSKKQSHGSMYRVRRALDQPEVDVENQHNGGYFNCSQRITCSKF